ncbi:hypothetical protein [Enterobacter roggenkampii]|uniref:hypothetical protein n=1 Tax=Enterobacter roggenkampii TaxID=1812935 RepID=UPI001FAE7E5B|nr:hypothetical protein [Enterobacter roggenkampii]
MVRQKCSGIRRSYLDYLWRFIPRMSDSANALVLHTGVGVRHLTLGKSATLHNQYVVSDAKWQFPSIATETSYLPINNIPTAIVFGSVSAS